MSNIPIIVITSFAIASILFILSSWGVFHGEIKATFRRLFRKKPKHDRYLVLNIVAFNRPKIYYK